MAIYFLNLTTFGRSAGSSAVNAAAYRSGERMYDERSGRTYDHSGRQDVLHKEIMLPNQFAAANMSWAMDRNGLWNIAERAEVQSNARVAREYLVALPAELSPQGRLTLVAGFSRELVERYRFALDIAIHAPRDYPGSDPRNFHAHLLATTREVTREGLGAKTTLEWSDTNRRQAGLGRAVGELVHVRERWALAANAALEQEHFAQRVDHRSLRAQGIDREPRPHIPRAAFEMERRGYRSAVADRIRADYEARVQARLQRSAQQTHLETGQNVAAQSEQRPALHGVTQTEAPSRAIEDGSKQAIARWTAYREAQAPQRSSDELAKEAALKWAAEYGPEARALRRLRGQEQTQERKQSELAPGSAKRAKSLDLSL